MIAATVITPRSSEREYFSSTDELGTMLAVMGFTESDRRGGVFRLRADGGERRVEVDDEHDAAEAALFLAGIR